LLEGDHRLPSPEHPEESVILLSFVIYVIEYLQYRSRDNYLPINLTFISDILIQFHHISNAIMPMVIYMPSHEAI
jgi:hypothetical protein